MKTSTSPSLLSGAALSSAEGFAVGFAVVGMLARVLTLNVGNFDAGVAISTLLIAGAGGLGGATLAQATAAWREQGTLFALAGFVGCGASYLLTTLLISSSVQPETQGQTAVTAIYMGQFAAVGALTGLLLGIASGSWKRLAFLTLAGALGFGIGFLVQSSLNDLLSDPVSQLVAAVLDDPRLHLMAASLLWGLASAATGFLGGAALGYALER